MSKLILPLIISFVSLSLSTEYTCDILIYETTPSGIIAAVAASNNTDLNVILLSTNKLNFGGMCSGGLGKTDIGNTSVIGGLSREFFIQNGQHYNEPIQWLLEPHVATQTFLSMLNNTKTNLIYDSPINQSSTIVSNNKIKSFKTLNGNTYSSSVFIDSSYEGDLMYSANISYTLGREANSQYNESNNGRLKPLLKNNFNVYVNPYDDNGNILPLVTEFDNEKPGEYDNKMEAYNYRLCVTKVANNKIPLCQSKPATYDANKWELLRRQYTLEPPSTSAVPSCNTRPVPNNKYDLNNCGSISTDFLGESDNYVNSSYEQRQIIAEAHRNYTMELFWFLCTDESVPSNVRSVMKNDWGLCKDEFTQTNGFVTLYSIIIQPTINIQRFPSQLYIREGRRMIGEHVFTEHDPKKGNINLGSLSIGMGSYNFDTHNVQRFACKNVSVCLSAPGNKKGCNDTKTCSYAFNEGDLEIHPFSIYEIPYTIIIPKKNEIINLLNSVTVSASHVGYATLRLEPQYMILGNAAGVASRILVQNMKKNGAEIVVQDIDLSQLSDELSKQNVVLHCSKIVDGVCQ